MKHFNALGLPEQLLQSLQAMQFHTPTPIQAETIPAALQGGDILGSAQTGTGKTAAYGIPLVNHLLKHPTRSALVLTPTRELAIQVLETVKQLLGKNTDIKTALLIGGDSMPKQLRQLSAKPRVIVGTPGRINDHLERRTLSLSATDFLVLDETDRMLDMGFSAQLQEIVRHLPEKRQTLMFSATMSPEIVKIAGSYLNDPLRIAVGTTNSPIAAITQEVLKTIEADKYGLLLELLENRQGTMIVFVKTKFGTERLALRLRKQGHEVEAIHGDLRQAKRERVIREFRAGKCRVLVATDVAARGLDIPHIECVVNYDLPQCPEDYIHRIGRTGRAGAQGFAVSLLTGADNGKWRGITRLMNESGSRAEVRMENRVGKPSTVAEKAAVEAEQSAEGAPRKERSERAPRAFEQRRRFEDRPFEKEGFAPRRERRERVFGPRPEGQGAERPFAQRSFDRRERAPRPFDGERRARFDRPSFGGGKPRFEERPFADRPRRPFGDKPSFSEKSRFDRPAFGGDKPQFGFDKPRFGFDKPRFGGDKPRFDNGKPRFGGDKPRFGSDKPRFGFDKPRFGGDKPFAPRGRTPFVDALVEKGPWEASRREHSSFGSGRPFGDRPPFARDNARPRFDRPGMRKPFGKKRDEAPQEA